MTKEELINKLFDEFEKDEETIKKNLLLVMDSVMLETSNDYQKITLNIKIEKRKSNDKRCTMDNNY